MSDRSSSGPRPKLPTSGTSESQPYPYGGHASSDGRGIGAMMATVRRNAYLILLMTVLTLAPVVYSVLTQAPVFQASGLIRLVDARGSIVGSIDSPANADDIGTRADVLLSRIEVLKGRPVMGQVVDREGLRLLLPPGLSREQLTDVSVSADAAPAELEMRFADDAFRVRYAGEEASGRYGSAVQIGGVHFTLHARPAVAEALVYVISRDAAIDWLIWNVNATIRPKTDAVLISVSDPDPHSAQQIANAVIEVFQAFDAAAAQERARKRRIFHETQLEATETSLVEALTALGGFRGRTQSYSSREAITAQQQALLSLDSQREQADAERQMYESLLRRLEQQPEERASILRTLVSSPGIASNAVVSQLYAQLVQYQAQRAGLTSGSQASTAAHPDVVRLDALIASTQTDVIAAVQSHVTSMRSRIAALDGLRGRNSSEMHVLPRQEVEEARLVQQVESLQRLADQLRDAVQKARMVEDLEVGQVEIVYAAPLPRSPVPGNKGLKLLAGLMVGLTLGLSSAFVRDAINTSLRRREDVEQLLRAPSLAIIPHVSAARNRPRLPWRGKLTTAGELPPWTNGAVAVSLPASVDPAAEAYRMLRNNLLFAANTTELRTLVITSGLPGEGKTLTAANLAVTMAQHGKRVLLIDCDLHRGRLHSMFQVPMEPGFGEVLSRGADLAATVHRTAVDGLWVLSSGTLGETTRELIGSERMKAVLARATEMFETVILDAPPVLAASETAVLCKLADGVLLVVRAGQTDQAAAANVARQLAPLEANVVGVVINDPAGWMPVHEHYYSYYAAGV